MLAIRDGSKRILRRSTQLSREWAALYCYVDKRKFLVRPAKALLRLPDDSVTGETFFERLGGVNGCMWAL
jgi:hypothetical protein